MSVEANIREYLKNEGITQISISRRTGIKTPKLSMALKERRKLTIDELVAICDTLKKTPNDFLLPIDRKNSA